MVNSTGFLFLSDKLSRLSDFCAAVRISYVLAGFVLCTFPCGIIEGQNAQLSGTVSLFGPQTVASGGSYLNSVSDIAVDKNGAVYINDSYNNRVIREVPKSGGGFTETVITSGVIGSSHSLAIDKNLNIFQCSWVTSNATCSWLQYNGSQTLSNGTYSTPANTVQMHTSTGDPKGLWVDSNGNLFISSYSTNYILEETPTSAGTNPYASTTETIIMSSTTSPTIGIPYGVGMTDSAGNLYVPTYGGNSIVKASFTGSTSPYTVTLSTLISGLKSPAEDYVDALGNIYVPNGNEIYKFIPKSGGGFTSTTIYSGTTGMTSAEMGIDAQGNIYGLGNYVAPITTAAGTVYPQSIMKVSQSAVNFGNVNIGSSSTQVLNFVFTSTSTLSTGSIAIFSSNGVSSPDYALATGANATLTLPVQLTATPTAGPGTFNATTCIPGTTYTVTVPLAAGATTGVYGCQVAVTFTPTQAGSRNATVQLLGAGGVVLGSGFITGTGVGPQLNYLPGTESKVLTATTTPSGIAADTTGSVYVATSGASSISKLTSSGGSYVTSSIGSGLSAPSSVAVDAYGNVYVADTGNNIIRIESRSGTAYTQTSLSTSALLSPAGIAVDGGGNVFIADTGNNRVIEEMLTSYGSYVESVIATNLGGPTGVAVDGAGNVYIADTLNNRILLETPNIGLPYPTTTYTQSTVATSYLSSPGQLAVDATGSLYIADTGNSRVIREQAPSSATAVETTVSSTSLNAPQGIAISPAGNIYISDSGNKRVIEEDIVDIPTLNYSAQAGAQSYTQTVTLLNVGNSALTFAVPTSGTNPSVPAGYAVSTTSSVSCPSISSSSSTPGTLAAGASCQLPISFTGSSTAGTVASNLVITDNNINATGAIQTIVLNGTSTADAETIFWAPATSISYGTAITSVNVLSATAEIGPTTIPGTFAYTFTPAGGSATALTSGTVLAPGNYTITAIFTPTAPSSYTVISSTSPLVVTVGQPAINWASSFSIIVKTNLTNVLNATATFLGNSVPGTFTYTIAPVGGTATPVVTSATPVAGTYTLTATFTPASSVSSNFAKVGAVATLVVNLPPPTIVWSTPQSIVYGTPLSAVLYGGAGGPVANFGTTTNLPGTWSYTYAIGAGAPVKATAATVLQAGTYTLSATFSPTDVLNYGIATASILLAVTPTTAAISLSASATASVANGNVTLTATVTSPAGTNPPSGTSELVVFYSGPVQIATVPLVSGVATLLTDCTSGTTVAACTSTASANKTTFVLPDGTDAITAVYLGDANLYQVSSPSISITISDFTITTNDVSVPMPLLGHALYTFAFTPVDTTAYPDAVAWAVSGLPAGFKATFNPTALPAGSSASAVTLTVQMVPQGDMRYPSSPLGKGELPVALCLLLLPFCARIRRGMRDKGWKNIASLGLIVIVTLGGTAALSSCSTSQASGTAASQLYLTVTATDGALVHAVTVNLNVLSN